MLENGVEREGGTDEGVFQPCGGNGAADEGRATPEPPNAPKEPTEVPCGCDPPNVIAVCEAPKPKLWSKQD